MKSLKLTTLVAATAVALSAFSMSAMAAEKVYKLTMAETWASNFLSLVMHPETWRALRMKCLAVV